MRNVAIFMFVVTGVHLALARSQAEGLPPGHVPGDVVSYSYVPIKTFTPQESIGILPYLMEYYVMKWTGDKPLEYYHDENIRRIDIVSQWSTAIPLYNRYSSYRDEIINLMIRCYRNRQLITLNARPRDDPEKNAHQNLIDILEVLWANRDNLLVSPEGDMATGRQLINNILAADLGDEGECSLRTAGLQQLYANFDQDIRLREMDGERPFSHIKGWYNMLGYAAFNYHSCYGASQADVDVHGRFLIPPNTQAIGVDVYHYWFVNGSPFDPADLTIARSRVRAHSDEWQRLRTRYYPEGLNVHVCTDSSNPATWIPECWNDTHALLNAIQTVGASNAMMWYIANSSQLVNVGSSSTFTTPIETMESYYDHLKAGPWAGVSWWYFVSDGPQGQGGIDYYDKTLVHCTAQHPEGVPYSQTMLNYWHNEYVALKMRMFNDVVYNQFGYLHIAPVIVEVQPDPDTARTRREYVRQLTLTNPTAQPVWSVITGPEGLTVSANGLVHGWTPTAQQIGQTITVTIEASNAGGTDQETWQIQVASISDLDLDGDADLQDFGYLQSCYSGSGIAPRVGCQDADLDQDGDVDHADFTRFKPCLAGPHRPPGC